jgi:hypothetical protein
MHLRFQALLGILLVLALGFSGRGFVSGQPAQTSDAQNQLVRAFVLVQQADMAGASPEQISQLANNLNLALRYQENSSQLSANLSTTTAAEALSLRNAAQEQVSIRQAVAYSTAVGAGFAFALLITEFHRVGEFARRLWLRSRQHD